jgi:hypothetical protein
VWVGVFIECGACICTTPSHQTPYISLRGCHIFFISLHLFCLVSFFFLFAVNHFAFLSVKTPTGKQTFFLDTTDANAHTYTHTLTPMNAHTHPTPISIFDRLCWRIISRLTKWPQRNERGRFEFLLDSLWFGDEHGVWDGYISPNLCTLVYLFYNLFLLYTSFKCTTWVIVLLWEKNIWHMLPLSNGK